MQAQLPRRRRTYGPLTVKSTQVAFQKALFPPQQDFHTPPGKPVESEEKAKQTINKNKSHQGKRKRDEYSSSSSSSS